MHPSAERCEQTTEAVVICIFAVHLQQCLISKGLQKMQLSVMYIPRFDSSHLVRLLFLYLQQQTLRAYAYHMQDLFASFWWDSFPSMQRNMHTLMLMAVYLSSVTAQDGCVPATNFCLTFNSDLPLQRMSWKSDCLLCKTILLIS